MENIVSTVTPRPIAKVFKSAARGSNLLQVSSGERQNIYKIVYVVFASEVYAYRYVNSEGVICPDDDSGKNVLMLVKIGDTPSYTRGIHTYYIDSEEKPLLHPFQGFVYPEALIAINVVKRVTISLFKAFIQKPLILSYFGFLLIPWRYKTKIIEKVLNGFNESANVVMEPHFLDPLYAMLSTLEISKYIKLFLGNLGISTDIASRTGDIVGHILEYDSAYRWVFWDVMSEANKTALLDNPTKEIMRLIGIYDSRSTNKKIKANLKVIGKALLLLKIPKVRRAFVRATREINFESLTFTPADRYQVMPMEGYNFFGKSFKERWDKYVALHNGNPPKWISVVGDML